MPLAVNVGGRVFHASEDTLRRCGSFLLRAFLFAGSNDLMDSRIVFFGPGNGTSFGQLE